MTKQANRLNFAVGRLPITLAGTAMGLNAVGMEFMPDRDYVACRICGRVYQSPLSRLPAHQINPETVFAAELHRREWSQKHAKQHTSTQHRQLQLSGRKFTPEAQQVLAPLGLISITDLVLDPENEHAGRLAPRKPTDDVEGT